MSEDPITQELRIEQLRQEQAAREHAEHAEAEEDTLQGERRADKAAYLRKKLEERAAAERKAAEED